MKLGVIDYGAGNLRSVLNTFEAAGVTGHLVRTPEDAAGVTHLVLPGVGAFGDCAEKLRSQELVPLIRTWIGQDKPFLGICVGYQVLFETGEEDEQYFYFVHSYYPQPEDESLAAAFCTYGVRFAAAIRRGNLVATQFHPEKSQKLGVKLLENFVSL